MLPWLQPVSRSQAARRNTAAFASVYERHHRALYRYCRSILHDEEEARDALQSTMAKALAALRFEERDFELRPWLFRIAHNEAVSRLRQRRDLAELDVAAAGAYSLAQAVEDRERLELLAADMRQLPERQRSALVLRELCGLGHAEIAAVLGSSPRAVKQTIFEARVALRECAEGRAMACVEVQRALSDGDRRVLRGRGMRAHMRSCRTCQEFKAALVQRPADLASWVPGLPAAASAGLLAHLLAALGAGGGSGAGVGALATKAAAVVATTAAVAGATIAVVGNSHDRPRSVAEAAAPLPHRKVSTVEHRQRVRVVSSTAHLRRKSKAAAPHRASRPTRGKRAARPVAPKPAQPSARSASAPQRAAAAVAPAPVARRAASATSHPAHSAHPNPEHPAHPVHPARPAHPAKAAKQPQGQAKPPRGQAKPPQGHARQPEAQAPAGPDPATGDTPDRPPGSNGTGTYAKPPGRARVAGGGARRRARGAK